MSQNENIEKVWSVVPFTAVHSGNNGQLSQTSFLWDSEQLYHEGWQLGRQTFVWKLSLEIISVPYTLISIHPSKIKTGGSNIIRIPLIWILLYRQICNSNSHSSFHPHMITILLLLAGNFGRAEGKHCFGACAAVRLLAWRWELLPEQKTLPATQRTVLYIWPNFKMLHSKLVVPTLLKLLPRPCERWYDPSTTATVTSS
jgi:hypothetical protein